MIDDITIAEISNYIQRKIGLYFPPEKHDDLRNKLTEVSKEYGFEQISDLTKAILNNHDVINENLTKVLASNLTIGETYFWRDTGLFRILEETILPNLIRKKANVNKTIRIWSAGCSSGEEPYSIAILIKRLIPDIDQWNITIKATDINNQSLRKAVNGVYTEWSFRNTPHWLKEKYFSKTGINKYSLDERVKSMVNFSYLNFFEDVYPSLANNTNAMDIILCRNVLMYFSIEDIKKISDHLYNCLTSDGILITTPSESFQFLSPRFKITHLKDVALYKRKSKEKTILVESKKNNAPSKIGTSVGHSNNKEKRLTNTNKLKTGTIRKTREIKNKVPNFDEAIQAYEKGDYNIALKIIEGLPKKETNQQSHLFLARIKANMGKLQEALSQCELAVSKNKLSPEAYYLKATIETEVGDTQSAYKTLKKALYLNPDFIIAHFTLGNLARAQMKHKEANKLYDNTLDLLTGLEKDEIIPESDGITAGRLKEIITSLLITG